MLSSSSSSNLHQRIHILLLGATGKTGRIVLSLALSQSLRVTALVRNASSLTPQQYLTIVQGNPSSAKDILTAINATPTKPTVIVSMLGQTRESGNPWSAPTSPPKYMSEAMANVVKVAKEQGIHRIVVMSMFGAAESFGSLSFLLRLVMRHSNMLQTLEDHDEVDRVVRSSGLEFTLVRPVMLGGEEEKEVEICKADGSDLGILSKVSMKSVARFVVEEVVRKNGFVDQSPIIAN